MSSSTLRLLKLRYSVHAFVLLTIAGSPVDENGASREGSLKNEEEEEEDHAPKTFKELVSCPYILFFVRFSVS